MENNLEQDENQISAANVELRKRIFAARRDFLRHNGREATIVSLTADEQRLAWEMTFAEQQELSPSFTTTGPEVIRQVFGFAVDTWEAAQLLCR